MKKIPNLTAIRFVFAFLVVIYHIPQFCENRGFPFYNDLAIFNKGTEAVYMFFSLSGFLIIRLLYLEKVNQKSISLGDFFIRRILRIFPLYYLVLLIGFLYYRLLLPYFGFQYDNNYNFIEGVLLSFTFFPNIFATYNPGGIIEVLWSIGIEEQFYLFIAPLLFLLPQKRIVVFLSFFTIIYFTLFISNYFSFLQEYNMLFFYFSFGGLCSILALNPKLNNKVQTLWPVFFLITSIYLSTSFFTNYLSKPLYHLFSMLFFGLSISLLSDKPIPLLENKVFNYLGKISFGIYLFHVISMQVIGLLFLKTTILEYLPEFVSILLFNVLVFATTLIVSHLSYKYYESYFLNLKQKFRYQKENQIIHQS